MDSIDSKLPNSLKYWLTATGCFTYLGFGLGSNILAVTMLDMRDFLNVTLVDMGYGLTIRASACCLGSIIVSYLFTRFNKQIGMLCSNLLLAFGLISIPIFGTKSSYFMSEVLIGLAYAGINNAPNALLTEIWQDKCNPYIQTMHFCSAIGSIMGPLVSEPFLASRSGSESAITQNASAIDSVHNAKIPTKSLIYIPLIIGSATILLAALSIIVLFIISPYKNVDRKAESKRSPGKLKATNYEELSPLIPRSEGRHYVTYVVLVCGLLFSCDGGLEQNFLSYMQVYSVSGPLKLSASTGAYLLSASSAALAAGRFVSIILATKVSPRAMLYLDGIIMITGSFVILLWNTQFGLSVGYILLGFGCSSVFPTIFAYAEQRINVTSYVTGVFTVFASVAGLIVPLFEGDYIETRPAIFSYLNIFCTALFLLFCVLLNLIDGRKSRAKVY